MPSLISGFVFGEDRFTIDADKRRVLRDDGYRLRAAVGDAAGNSLRPERFPAGADGGNGVVRQGVRGGDASCEVVSLAFTSGVSQLGVVGSQRIGVRKGGGVEGDAVEGVASERNVLWVVCMVFLLYCGLMPSPGPLPQGESHCLYQNLVFMLMYRCDPVHYTYTHPRRTYTHPSWYYPWSGRYPRATGACRRRCPRRRSG